MQSSNDLFSNLLPEIRQAHLYPDLSVNDCVQAQFVSKSWYGVFAQNDVWQLLITRDFGISTKTLLQFLALVKQINRSDVRVSFSEIYRHLYYLTLIKSHQQKEYIKTFLQPIYHLSLLACCVNDKTDSKIIRELIPRDEHEVWLQMAILLRAQYTVTAIKRLFLYDRYPRDSVQWAIESGNLEMTNFVCGCDIRLPLFSTSDFECFAAVHGHEEIFKYIFLAKADRNKPELKPFLSAAKGGNVTIIDHLYGFYHNANAFLDHLEVAAATELLGAAAESGVIEMFHKILKLLSRDDIDDSRLKSILNKAAGAGSVDIVRYFFERKVIPHNDILLAAARSGNLELFRYLHLHPVIAHVSHQYFLDNAAYSGNLELVQYILDINKQFNLRPTFFTLSQAMNSGNLELVKYLLDIDNYLDLSKTINIWYAANANKENREMVHYLLEHYHFKLSGFFSGISAITLCSPILESWYQTHVKLTQFIEKNNTIDTECFFDAVKMSVRDFFTVAIRFLQRPKTSGLSDENINILLEFMKHTYSEASLIERMWIADKLQSTSDDRLRDIVNSKVSAVRNKI